MQTQKLRIVALISVLTWLTPSLTWADEPTGAVEPDVEPLSDAELASLIKLVSKAGYYGLKDPKEKAAIAELRKHADQAAPKLAEMLAVALRDRKMNNWISLYRPLYLMQGMPEAIRLALPDVTKALADTHIVNVAGAARLLTELGPEAKSATPALLEAWDKVKDKRVTARAIVAKALKAVDPEAAAKANIE